MRRTIAAAAAAAFVVLSLPLAAAAAGSDGKSFGVSTPSQSLQLKPGESTDTWIGLANQTDRPLILNIRQITLVPRDDGHFDTLDRPDPNWAGRVQFAPQTTLAPNSGLHVPVHVTMPMGVVPDLYLVGFLVEPEVAPTPGAVTVRNQITTFLTLEVPGKRHPGLQVLWSHLPTFRFGKDVKGSFRVKNTGGNTTVFRGQVRIDSWRGKNVTVLQATGDQAKLLPSGVSRTVSYHWRVPGLFFVGRTHLEIDYPNGTATMQAVRKAGPLMVIVPPQALAVPVVIAIGVLLWRLKVRRARAAAAKPTAAHPRAARPGRPVPTAATPRSPNSAPRPRRSHLRDSHAGRPRRRG